MNPNLGKTSFSPPELAQLRAEASSYIDRHAMTQKKFAEEAGVAEGTFGPWLKGSYAGDNEKVAASVYRYLTARKETEALAAMVPTAPGYQETTTSLRIFAALEHAQVFGDVAVVGVAPGMGKTATITQFKAVRPRVTVVTLAPSSRGAPNALIATLEAMGEAEVKGTPQALSRRIAAKATAGALLVVDEAQHASQQAVDEFRSIHDKTGVGLVFSGDESLFTLFDGRSRAAFAQFHSRVGSRVRQSRPVADDVKVMARAWEVSEPAQVKLMHEIAMKPGALRGLTKTMLLAKRMAAMTDQPLSTSLIREAWAHRSPDLAA